MNLMLIDLSTPKLHRAVRLPEGNIPAVAGTGVSKSAATPQVVALSATRMKHWSDLSKLDVIVVQIDGVHVTEKSAPAAAIGIDGQSIRSGSWRERPNTACRAQVAACLHKHHRERHGHDASRHSQCKHWKSAPVALRRTGAATPEAKKGFRRLKTRKQLPALRTTLDAHYASNKRYLDLKAKAA